MVIIIMKVLYFFTSGFDSPNPSYHLMEAMIKDTLDAGIDVHMIASHTTGINEDVPKHLNEYNNFTYTIVKRKCIKKDAFVKRYLNGIKYAFDCIKHIRNISNYDLIYVQSCPTVLYNILVSKIYGNKKPVIYSIQDMFPGSSIHSGVMNKKWMQKIFFVLQKIAYRKANYITVISDDMKQKVIEQGVPENKIVTIVNWFDDTSVREIQWDDNRFVKKHNLTNEKFYVQYAGTMGYVFDYKMVLKVAKILKDYKDIEFQMIGQGSQKNIFIKEKEELGLDNIVFYELEPQNMVSDVYSTCSICLIPLKKGIIGNSVPSKAGLLMACNRTIVNSVDDDSDYFRIFNENDMGISASNDNPKAVADAILDLYNNPQKRNRLALNGHEYGKRYYSRSLNTKRLVDLFNNIVLK